jgi:hypothetical protein
MTGHNVTTWCHISEDHDMNLLEVNTSSLESYPAHIWGCIQKFPDWPPGARTANGTALCHEVHLYRYFMSQSSEFCRHNPLCCFSTSVYCCFLISLSTQSGNFWIYPRIHTLFSTAQVNIWILARHLYVYSWIDDRKRWLQVEVFWVVMSCSVAIGYEGFRDPCCVHLQGEPCA